MKDHITAKIELMLKRYEKLGLTDSWLYKQLQYDVHSEEWLDDVVATVSQIRNAEKIFDVVGQITEEDNDHRLMTMFAEYDTARRLGSWAKGFFGTFTDAEYLPRIHKCQPDFKAWRGEQILPVETKTLSGAGLCRS